MQSTGGFSRAAAAVGAAARILVVVCMGSNQVFMAAKRVSPWKLPLPFAQHKKSGM